MALIKLNTRSLADASVTTDKLINNGNLGRRNVIINGAMQIWQRGTSSTSAGGYFTVDRFSIQNNTQNARSTDVPSQFQYSLDLTGTTGGSSGYAIFDQNIESSNINHMVGQTVTLSAYVKNVGTSTVNLSCELYYANSTDNFSSVTYISSPTSQAITTGWTRVTFPSFTVPANAANGLRIRLFRYDASNNQQWRITGIQLELGTTATPFEHRSYGEELSLCQRYYEKGNSVCRHPFQNQLSHVFNTPVFYKAKKRATPNVVQSNGYTVDGMGSYGIEGHGSGGYDNKKDGFAVTTTTTTSANSISMVQFDWYADAEL